MNASKYEKVWFQSCQANTLIVKTLASYIYDIWDKVMVLDD